MSKPTAYFIGVDVGTGSVRAALVSEQGKIVASQVQEIKTWNDQPDFYEQSFEDIWQSTIKCVKTITEGICPKSVKGIGFDATCSMVCYDKAGKPLSVSPKGNNEQNIILWMDHRAVKEAEFINNTKHEILKFVGGKVFPEMETPKLLWLKKNLKEQCWDKAGLFFDLPDALTHRATGSESRSTCSLVCKWNYEMNEKGQEQWNKSFFDKIGLGDLAEDNWKKIGSVIQAPGDPVGKGLTEQAAKDFGLEPGTPVGTSMIDAHAGGLGLVGCTVKDVNPAFHTRIGLICGTSTCHMAVSKGPTFTPGIWGPYKSAMIPGMWLNEGGQSATGKLLDHIVDTHPASKEIKQKIGKKHIHIYLNEVLEKMAKRENKPMAMLTEDLHVLPDFHGNRSPLADPSMKGIVMGLTLAADEESLALIYLATVQALSYGTRHIIETLKKQSGYNELQTTLLCGGLSKNPVFTQAQADVCNMATICPDEIESVLLGAAILGACGAKYFENMTVAIQTMGGTGKLVKPDSRVIEFHNNKYKVFLDMLKFQIDCRKIMTPKNAASGGGSCPPECKGFKRD